MQKSKLLKNPGVRDTWKVTSNLLAKHWKKPKFINEKKL